MHIEHQPMGNFPARPDRTEHRLTALARNPRALERGLGVLLWIAFLLVLIGRGA